MDDQPLEERTRQFARRDQFSFQILDRLGAGNDGNVWATSRNSVVKAFNRQQAYSTELRCYQRLSSERVADIDGLEVPQLLNWDDELRVIEMTLVHPPYFLDFGKAYIDEPAPYSREELARWYASWLDFFPRSDISRVHKVLRILKGYGIDYVDPRPWNIRFRAEDDPDEEDRQDDQFDDAGGEDY